MSEIVSIPIADLLVDQENARLKDPQPSQQAAMLALARQQGTKLLKLAQDIVEHGVDPTLLPVVIPTSDQRKRYTVLEGNRRVTTLKALETPSLISPAFDAAGVRQLNRLAARYQQKPLSELYCVLFPDAASAEHWIKLRHTGQRDGEGLVPWGAEEKDRYEARHGNLSPEGQICDFVEKHGFLSEAAKASSKRFITNLRRLIKTPRVREVLGIQTTDGKVYSHYPAEEVAKGLTRILEDLKTEALNVGDIYEEADRIGYANTLPVSARPDPATRLEAPVLLSDIDKGVPGTPTAQAGKKKPASRRSQSSKNPRTSLIPKSCQLNINHPRINDLYIELLNLSVDQYPNSCSVALRVFVELSVDHYIEQHNSMDENTRRNSPLVKKLKTVAGDLHTKGKISAQLLAVMEQVAEGGTGVLGAKLPTFNMYVHNHYVFPKPGDLRLSWDEMQPFFEKLWA